MKDQLTVKASSLNNTQQRGPTYILRRERDLKSLLQIEFGRRFTL
jgi:hypothetical protein